MKNAATISKIAVVSAVVLGILGFISRIISTPLCGVSPRAMAMSAGLLLLLSIALNTLGTSSSTPKQ